MSMNLRQLSFPRSEVFINGERISVYIEQGLILLLLALFSLLKLPKQRICTSHKAAHLSDAVCFQNTSIDDQTPFLSCSEMLLTADGQQPELMAEDKVKVLCAQ